MLLRSHYVAQQFLTSLLIVVMETSAASDQISIVSSIIRRDWLVGGQSKDKKTVKARKVELVLILSTKWVEEK